MPHPAVRVVDVYPYRRAPDGPLFLLLQRAPDVMYAGSWRMVGGKIEEEETAWQTARRELVEETGLAPARLWTVPSLNKFYEWQADRVTLIPPFAAEVDGRPVLNAEHQAFAWLPPEDAAARLHWPEQRRLLRLTARMLQDGVPDELVIE